MSIYGVDQRLKTTYAIHINNIFLPPLRRAVGIKYKENSYKISRSVVQEILKHVYRKINIKNI